MTWLRRSIIILLRETSDNPRLITDKANKSDHSSFHQINPTSKKSGQNNPPLPDATTQPDLGNS